MENVDPYLNIDTSAEKLKVITERIKQISFSERLNYTTENLNDRFFIKFV